MRAARQLARLLRANCDASKLGILSQRRLKEILENQDHQREWPAVEEELRQRKLADLRGGVNAGDQRAL